MTDFSTQLANSENLGSLNSQSWEFGLKTFSLTSKSQWNRSSFKIHWNGVSKTQIYLVVSYRFRSLWSLDLRLPTQVRERRQGGLGFEWFQLESMVFYWVLLHLGSHGKWFLWGPWRPNCRSHKEAMRSSLSERDLSPGASVRWTRPICQSPPAHQHS